MKHIALILSFIFGLIAFLYIFGYFELYLGLIPSDDVPIAIEGTIDFFEAKYELLGQDIGSILFIIVCVVLCSYFYSLYHRLNRRKKDTIDIDSIQGPFVLYLRSFIDDSTTRKRISTVSEIRTEEEVFVDVLTDIAPVYAIGDPSDTKMPLGASRIYVDNENWKSTVMELAQRAAVVVLRLGKTDSFWWEVEMAVNSVPIEKILFIIPESKTFNNVANLYKILLNNNIDIHELDINIEKKRHGSISGFLYFDKNGAPETISVQTPRFTQLLISYEQQIRNALDDYRIKFGLQSNRKLPLRRARIYQLLIIVGIVFMIGSLTFKDYVSLKYQMPYELVEKCIDKPVFVDKYSKDINGINLVNCILESKKGLLALDGVKCRYLFEVEAKALALMDYDEFEQIGAAYKNMLLMIKKYTPDDYPEYINILSEAVVLSITNVEETTELIKFYKNNINNIPDWLFDVINKEYKTDYEYILNFNKSVMEHFDEEDIDDIIKTLLSQTVAPN